MLSVLWAPTLWALACLVIELHLIDLKYDMEHLWSRPSWSQVTRKERQCVRNRWKIPSLTFKSKITHRHTMLCAAPPASLGWLAAEFGTDCVFTPLTCNPRLWSRGESEKTALNIASVGFESWSPSSPLSLSLSVLSFPVQFNSMLLASVSNFFVFLPKSLSGFAVRSCFVYWQMLSWEVARCSQN